MNQTVKTFTISKKQIINALATEPIGSYDVATTSKPFAKGTKLTAVGAVLRSLAASHKSAKVIFDLNKDGFNEVASYNTSSVEALNVLENEYTMLRSGMRTPKLRTTLTGWVKEIFPAKIEFTVWNPAVTSVVA